MIAIITMYHLVNRVKEWRLVRIYHRELHIEVTLYILLKHLICDLLSFLCYTDEEDDEMLSEEILKGLQDNFKRQPRFRPFRRGEEPKGWEERSGITREALEEGRRNTKKILDDIIYRHPFVEDLVNYFLPMIELAVPTDKIYLVLLHCALQWARNHVTSNCGGNCAMGNPKDLKDSTCCTLRVIKAFSEYLKDNGDPAFQMGYFAEALGCINGRQGFCRTLNHLFQRCAALDEKDQPEVVVEVLTAVLDHFDKFKIPTFVFSLAGVSTEVNDKILAKIEKSDYDAVTVCPVKVYHAQHFDVPSPSTAEDVDYADTCLRTSKTMTESTSNVSKCLEGHFNKCGHSAHTLSLFEHACRHSDLRMVQKDPTKEMFEKMATSIKHDKDTSKVRSYCLKYPDQLVSEAPILVQEYATRNWIEIYMRRQEYCKQKRSPLLPPESIEDVSFTCRYLLSNMGTNSWLVQQERDGSQEATSARMSAISKPRRKKSDTTNKRKKKDTSKSIKLAPKKKRVFAKTVRDGNSKGGTNTLANEENKLKSYVGRQKNYLQKCLQEGKEGHLIQCVYKHKEGKLGCSSKKWIVGTKTKRGNQLQFRYCCRACGIDS